MIENYINKVIQGDCLSVMKEIPKGERTSSLSSVDCPYCGCVGLISLGMKKINIGYGKIY